VEALRWNPRSLLDPMASEREAVARTHDERDERAYESVSFVSGALNTIGELIEELRTVGGRKAVALMASQADLVSLAERTGGFGTVNSNTFGHALQGIEDDQKGYYLIGFKVPPGIKDTPKAKNFDFNTIRVRVKRPGLQIRARAGFWGETDAAARPKHDTPQAQMRLAFRAGSKVSFLAMVGTDRDDNAKLPAGSLDAGVKVYRDGRPIMSTSVAGCHGARADGSCGEGGVAIERCDYAGAILFGGDGAGSWVPRHASAWIDFQVLP
jgi:hypothetical protein